MRGAGAEKLARSRWRKKLLPVVDEKHPHNDSFIANGPLNWIDKESDFSPTIYTCLDKILLAGKDFEDRIKRIPKPKRTKLEDLSTVGDIPGADFTDR